MKTQARRGAALVAALSGLVLSIALLRPASLAADERWGANYFPNVPMTTQDGEEVRFYDLIKGKIVAIDLMYTNCEYACPLETARMARMQQLLSDRMGRDVFFISISIDPEHDTPAALKAYAQKYNAGPGWYFLRGRSRDEIDALSKKLGLWSDPSLSTDGHTAMLLIGNEATGQWTQTSALDNPAYTARIIGTWMNSFQTAKPGKSYAEAPPIDNRDQGKYLFNSLCANCHTVGKGDKVGPDLAAAFDARERDWLLRYTLEPDVLRANGDPIAKALMKKFGEVRMPNMSLAPAEAQAILRYVDAQKRATQTVAMAASHETMGASKGAPSTSVPSRAAQASGDSPLVGAAIAIQTALANDSTDGITAQATALRTAAAALGAPAAAIETAAAELATQTTLADARRVFGTASEALVAYVRANPGSLGPGVRIGYCPMLRKSWLQKDGPVANPYYGQRMLTCGELTN